MQPINTLRTAIISKKDSIESFEGMSIPHSILSIIPYDLAIEYFVLPFGVDEHGRIQALMAYPGDAEALQCLQLHTGACIRPVEVPKDALVR
jgi:hypothetical protein